MNKTLLRQTALLGFASSTTFGIGLILGALSLGTAPQEEIPTSIIPMVVLSFFLAATITLTLSLIFYNSLITLLVKPENTTLRYTLLGVNITIFILNLLGIYLQLALVIKRDAVEIDPNWVMLLIDIIFQQTGILSGWLEQHDA